MESRTPNAVNVLDAFAHTLATICRDLDYFTRTVLLVALSICLSEIDDTAKCLALGAPSLRRGLRGRSFSTRGQAAPFAGPYKRRCWIGRAWGKCGSAKSQSLTTTGKEILLHDL